MDDDLQTEAKELLACLKAILKTAEEERALHIIWVAFNYAAWMASEGADDTYSTFCDNFGYPAREGEDRPRLYRRVQSVISAAFSAVREDGPVTDLLREERDDLPRGAMRR